MIALSSLVLVLGGAVSLVAFLEVSRRAEALLAFFVLAGLLVLVPMHALGAAGWLSAGSVVLGPSVAGAAAIVVAAAHLGPRPFGSLALRVLRRLVRVPVDAFAITIAARSTATLALALSLLVGVHALVSGYLLPSDAWDGIWYHETMIGAAVQARGYAPMALPDNLLQQANGFPRNAEMTSLYFTTLWDRRFVELPNTLAAIPLALATYLAVRRFARRRATAIGWACVGILVPGCAVQLRSTYVDVYAAAAFVAAIWFATKRGLRARDLALGAAALALYVGAKPSAPIGTAALVVLVSVRLWRAHGLRGLLHAVLYTTPAAAFAALTYLRNYVSFGNPLWPLSVESARLGVHWPGVLETGELSQSAGLWLTLAAIFGPHAPGRDFADVRIGGYGEAFAWVVLPIATVGLAFALLRALRPPPRRKRPRRRVTARELLLLLSVPLLTVVTSPAIWSARYHLAAISLAGAALVYVVDHAKTRVVGEGSMLAAIILSAVHLVRLDPPLGGAGLRATLAYVALPAQERAVRSVAEWTLDADVARAREVELGPGSVVAFGPGVAFPGVLWNERYDNRLVYVPEDIPWRIGAALGSSSAKWTVARPGEPLFTYVSQRPEHWQRIGFASRGQPTIAFRRIDPPIRSALPGSSVP